MARKSRRTLQASTQTIHQELSCVCPTAIYARLSIENSGKDDEGDSIANQILFCQNYLKERPEFTLYGIYTDNGETGTDFQRPEFQKLMDDVKRGFVKCIIVKDLSRFGRNYIETGEYLEKVFPVLGVRFIAITDGYDSAISTDAEVALMIPLKNMINDVYAKDISRKVITSIKTRQESGNILPAFPPYGYLKSKKQQYCYEIDQKTAPFVQMIFQWKAMGKSNDEICKQLNEIGAITPARRKVELGHWSGERYKETKWSGRNRSITDILKNPTYTGCIVYGRKRQSLYEGMRKQKKSQEEWGILPNMHEAIVDQQLFDKVQEILAMQKRKTDEKMEQSQIARKNIVNLFQNKIYCGDCGKRMRFCRRKDKNTGLYTYEASYFECGGYVDTKRCTRHTIHYKLIYDVVLEILRAQLKITDSQEEELKKGKQKKSLLEYYAKECNAILLEIQKINTKREGLFEQFIEGILDEKEYQFAKAKYNEKIEKLQIQLKEVREQKSRVEEVVSGKCKWLQIVKRASEMGDGACIESLVKEIRIYEGKRIEVDVNYQEEKLVFEKIVADIYQWKGEA